LWRSAVLQLRSHADELTPFFMNTLAMLDIVCVGQIDIISNSGGSSAIDVVVGQHARLLHRLANRHADHSGLALLLCGTDNAP
jgi:hypothetical protein